MEEEEEEVGKEDGGGGEDGGNKKVWLRGTAKLTWYCKVWLHGAEVAL